MCMCMEVCVYVHKCLALLYICMFIHDCLALLYICMACKPSCCAFICICNLHGDHTYHIHTHTGSVSLLLLFPLSLSLCLYLYVARASFRYFFLTPSLRRAHKHLDVLCTQALRCTVHTKTPRFIRPPPQPSGAEPGTFACACACACAGAGLGPGPGPGPFRGVSMHVCARVCARMCVCGCVCMCVCMCACMGSQRSTHICPHNRLCLAGVSLNLTNLWPT